MLRILRLAPHSSLLCGLGAVVCVGQPRASSSPRFGDTPLIRAWVKEYHCPQSAVRLPPIRITPPSDFSRAEACAVTWRASEAWRRSKNLYGTRIDPRDSTHLTGAVINHPNYRIVVGKTKETNPNKGFTVTFYRGTASAIIVGFEQNTDAGVVGPGHPTQQRADTAPNYR